MHGSASSRKIRADLAPSKSKPTKVSDTDPDTGYRVRDQNPEGFFYLDHRTVDGRHGLITDAHVTPAMFMMPVLAWNAWIVSAGTVFCTTNAPAVGSTRKRWFGMSWKMTGNGPIETG
jgi:hypothetical protein